MCKKIKSPLYVLLPVPYQSHSCCLGSALDQRPVRTVWSRSDVSCGCRRGLELFQEPGTLPRAVQGSVGPACGPNVQSAQFLSG